MHPALGSHSSAATSRGGAASPVRPECRWALLLTVPARPRLRSVHALVFERAPPPPRAWLLCRCSRHRRKERPSRPRPRRGPRPVLPLLALSADVARIGRDGRRGGLSGAGLCGLARRRLLSLRYLSIAQGRPPAAPRRVPPCPPRASAGPHARAAVAQRHPRAPAPAAVFAATAIAAARPPFPPWLRAGQAASLHESLHDDDGPNPCAPLPVRWRSRPRPRARSRTARYACPRRH